MTAYTITAELDYDDLDRDQTEHIIEGLAGHGPVVATNDAGHHEILLSVDAPSLSSAVKVALLLLEDEGAAVPRLRSIVVEPAADFDARVTAAMVDIITASTLGEMSAEREAEAKAQHPAYRRALSIVRPAPDARS